MDQFISHKTDNGRVCQYKYQVTLLCYDLKDVTLIDLLTLVFVPLVFCDAAVPLVGLVVA